MAALPPWVFRFFGAPRWLYNLGLGRLLGPRILLLTTTGRKSGLARQTPLQYERVNGRYIVASLRGTDADWFRNLLAEPHVTVQVGAQQFAAVAEPVTEPAAVADFIRLRLARHPRMVGAILRADGQQPGNDAALRAYAEGIALAVLHPRP